MNVRYGPPWALIQAETEVAGLPEQVSISMFRICFAYAERGPECLSFEWGLSISECGIVDISHPFIPLKIQSPRLSITGQFNFQGADKW